MGFFLGNRFKQFWFFFLIGSGKNIYSEKNGKKTHEGTPTRGAVLPRDLHPAGGLGCSEVLRDPQLSPAPWAQRALEAPGAALAAVPGLVNHNLSGTLGSLQDGTCPGRDSSASPARLLPPLLAVSPVPEPQRGCRSLQGSSRGGRMLQTPGRAHTNAGEDGSPCSNNQRGFLKSRTPFASLPSLSTSSSRSWNGKIQEVMPVVTSA